MSAIGRVRVKPFVPPSTHPQMPECTWCGLRVSVCKLLASPTCAECRDGGRNFRVQMYQQRLRRAAGAQ